MLSSIVGAVVGRRDEGMTLRVTAYLHPGLLASDMNFDGIIFGNSIRNWSIAGAAAAAPV